MASKSSVLAILARSVGGRLAAFPQHMAVSLRLTVKPLQKLRRLRLRFSTGRGIASGKKEGCWPESRRLSARCCGTGAMLEATRLRLPRNWDNFGRIKRFAAEMPSF